MTTNERPSRERLWLFGLVILVCVLGFSVHVAMLEREAEALVGREDAARGHLLRVVAAQARHQERTGRFGSLPELLAAGELDGYAAGPDTADAPALLVDGYRIDVLLPARGSAEGQVLLTLGNDDEVSADLRAKYHAVVARPQEPGVSGYRTLYADESGDLYLSEGVSDEPSRMTNPLPRVHLSSGTPRSPLGLVWMRWEDIDARWR